MPGRKCFEAAFAMCRCSACRKTAQRGCSLPAGAVVESKLHGCRVEVMRNDVEYIYLQTKLRCVDFDFVDGVTAYVYKIDFTMKQICCHQVGSQAIKRRSCYV